MIMFTILSFQVDNDFNHVEKSPRVFRAAFRTKMRIGKSRRAELRLLELKFIPSQSVLLNALREFDSQVLKLAQLSKPLFSSQSSNNPSRGNRRHRKRKLATSDLKTYLVAREKVLHVREDMG